MLVLRIQDFFLGWSFKNIDRYCCEKIYTLTIINQSLFLPNLHSPYKIGCHDSKEKKSKIKFTTSYGSMPLVVAVTVTVLVVVISLFDHHHLLLIRFNNQYNHNHKLKKTKKFLLQCKRRKIHTIHKALREKHTRSCHCQRETDNESET